MSIVLAPGILVFAAVLIFNQKIKDFVKRNMVIFIIATLYYLITSFYYGIGEMSIKQNAPLTEMFIIPVFLLANVIYISYIQKRKHYSLFFIPILSYVMFKALYINNFFQNIYLLIMVYLFFVFVFVVFPILKLNLKFKPKS